MRFRFADVEIDVARRELRRAGEAVDVQPQVLDVLVHLIRHRDRVVSKEELLDEVWQHRFVTESALTSRIKSARRAIGDDGRAQRMIKTVHGRGYRFLPAIEADPTEPGAAAVSPIDGRAPGDGDTRPRPLATTLPDDATPFVGRRVEQDRIMALLADPTCRLLTIVAPGGMGKTRLAIQVARRVAPTFEDGVAFVPFAPVTDEGAMSYAIADSLGLALEARGDPFDQLSSYLGSREVLLVLDNLEHLASSELVPALLEGVPGVTILATSRERLRLRAEWTFDLGGLGSPDGQPSAASDDDGSDPERDAIELFTTTAARIAPDARLDATARPAIGRICQLVGGMPLALELAAGWCEVLPVEQIAEELGRGPELLETDLHDVPDRQRSVRAVFDASWARLAPRERDVFRRLCVFRGTIDRAAAIAVAGADLATLRRLHGTSMVAVADGGRWRIHELLRQYGEELLTAAGRAGEVRRAHHDHFLDLLADAAGSLRAGPQRDTLRRLTTDMDDIRAAWSDAVATGDLAGRERTIEHLWLLFDARGRLGEMGLLVDAALTTLGRVPPADAADQGLLVELLRAAQGMTRAQLGALEEGAAQLAGAIAALEATAVEAADRSLLALVDLWYGWVTFLLARNAEAEAAAARALARYAADDDRWGVARCQYLLGNSYTARGELLAAVAPLVASRATADELGDRRGAGMARRNLCILAGWFGRYDEARAHIGVAAEVSEELDDRLGLAYARRELGKLLVAEGRYADAVATLEASIAVTDDIENRWESAATADDLGNALAAGGDVDAAERALVACRRVAEESSNRYYVARATGDLGALALRRGDRDRAEWFLTAARAQWRDFGHEPYAAWVEVQLGHLAGLDPGGRDAAGSRYAASLTLAVRHGLAPFAMDALVGAAALGLLDGAGARAGALHLAASHPATTHEVRERARSVLADDAAAPGAEPASADVDTPDAWRAVAVAVAERLAR